ncbi:hypothetical protein A1F94_008061 [Pyrenophora tritici-repentis]|nr:hypothetical protein A1F94_008061 [Pyrenophora tritici-repentis]
MDAMEYSNDVHGTNQDYEMSRQLILIDLIQLMLDHPSRHLHDLMRHNFPVFSTEQLQHPVFYDVIMAAVHDLDVQQAELIAESRTAHVYEKRLEEINKANADKMAAKQQELVVEKKSAVDLKLESAADKNHIAELTQRLAEMETKLLEASGPKMSFSIRTKDDQEVDEDFELPAAENVASRKGKHRNHVQKNNTGEFRPPITVMLSGIWGFEGQRHDFKDGSGPLCWELGAEV